MAVVVVRRTWHSRLLEERVLCAAVILIVACGLRDVLVLRLSQHAFEVVPWVRFAWMGFAMSMAWVIAERMRKDSLALARMNMNLQHELDRRNADLAAAFERERENEKRSGALQERQRLMRDLHDGLGSHLVSALRVAQQGQATPDDMTQQLREAVDRLRITVDAMHEPDGDIAAALAAVRYRLAPRLQAAGIDLRWDVDALDSAPGWGVREAHHLQMLLYEAFGNMIAHSRATHALLTARHSNGSEVRIELSDDGCGFDPTLARAAGGKGLANMEARSAALRARFDIQSGAEGTRLVLVLPLA
jgi:signal transduction histidine kinase